ncbi:hypothetical protein [Bradyrhizobium sp. RT3b]|uniref:hypothetical protein n=1 Tax=Bradyrhizobium sp. RT3b TaxID=3156334 RepID=UPI00339195CF
MSESKTSSAIRKVLTGPVVVRAGEKIHRVPLVAAILMSQAERALEGRDSAAETVLKIASAYGLFDQTEETRKFDLEQLSDGELAVFERLTAKCDYRRRRSQRIRPWRK